MQVHVALCADYPTWLADNEAVLESKRLVDLILIEAHDAGTYDLKDFSDRPDNDPFAPDDDNIFIDIGTYLTPGVVMGMH